MDDEALRLLHDIDARLARLERLVEPWAAMLDPATMSGRLAGRRARKVMTEQAMAILHEGGNDDGGK